MIGRLWRRWREQVEARRARVLRHTYAPRLEAFREIARLPEVVAEPAHAQTSKVVHMNLLVSRDGRRRVA